MNHKFKQALIAGPLVIFAGTTLVGFVVVSITIPWLSITFVCVIGLTAWATWAGTKLLNGEWHE